MSNKHTKYDLPASSSNEDLETISRNKFSNLFDPALFELRPENLRDKGIDLTIEIKKDNQYTNFRFAVQIKSTAKIGRGHVLSYAVEVSNINYLLNFGMPSHYVLFHSHSNTFYIEPVNEVYKNLIKKYKGKLPKTFKIRFSKLLDAESISEIYKQTYENGIFLRKLKPHLASANSGGGPTRGLVVDEDNEVYSVEQNIAFICEFGLKMLNTGEFDQIIEIEQRTYSPLTIAPPGYFFVCGMAYLQRANLFKAIEFLKLAQEGAEQFEPDIGAMLIYSLAHAKHLLGMTNEDDFKDEISKVMDSQGIGSFLQIEKAYKTFLNNKKGDSGRIQTLYKTMRSIVSKANNDQYVLLMTYSNIMEAEQTVLVNDLTRNFLVLCGRVSDLSSTNTYSEWLALEEKYSLRLNLLIKFAFKQQHYLAFSNLLSKKTDWTYSKIFIKYFFKNWNPEKGEVEGILSEIEFDQLQETISELDKLIESYEFLKHKENCVTTLFRKYEILHFCGKLAESEALAKEITTIIEKNEFNGLKLRLYELRNGGTSHEKYMQSVSLQLKKIYEVAAKCGIEPEYLFGKISTQSLELIEKDIEWSISDFFEFDLPNTPTAT